MIDLLDFWTKAHEKRDARWLAFSDPTVVLARFGIDPNSFQSMLEIGPGALLLANWLTYGLGKKVFVHDIVQIDDPRFVANLPLDEPVDVAIAHLVFQHVPPDRHHSLIKEVLASLKPGGKFYFDAVTPDCPDNPELLREFFAGSSFPFTAWDLVTTKQQVGMGYFFCVAQA